jgi:hypothetical protein
MDTGLQQKSFDPDSQQKEHHVHTKLLQFPVSEKFSPSAQSSVSDPDSSRSVDPYLDPGGQKGELKASSVA